VPVNVATGGHTYAEMLREAERIAAIKDPAKREAAYRRWEAELDRAPPPLTSEECAEIRRRSNPGVALNCV